MNEYFSNWTRIVTQLALLQFCIILVAFGNNARAATSRPNFLIFLADDMGFSDAGCYGGEIATPNLDSLAAHGIRYTQFHNTARCWPTRAALLTGYYAQEVGFDDMPGMKGPRRRPPWAHLISEYLQRLGYRCYHSGKWHLDSSAIRCGFDRSYTLLDYNHNFSPKHHTLDDRPLPPVHVGDGYYSAVAIANHAIDFLKEHQQKHSGQPFFTYVAFTVPHFPLQAPPDDIARYEGRYQSGWDVMRRDRWQRIQKELHLPGELSALETQIGPPYRQERAHKELGDAEVWHETPWDELTDEQRDFQSKKMSIHAAMVTCMDRQIGRVLDQIHAMHADENTLVLFFSDNGASAEIMIRGDGNDPTAPLGSAASFVCLGPGFSNASNTPFRRHKTWVHEGGIATPLIARWPAGISDAGQLRHAVGHVIDIAPTLLHLAGGEWPKEFDGSTLPPNPGHDLSATFSEDVPVVRDCLWWLHDGNRAIRKDDWKLVAARKEPWQLYDLAHDRAENHNLAASHPDKVKALSELWQSRLDEFKKLAQRDAVKIPKSKKRAKSKRSD
ncbi:MAG TPA: arylsulfatase [Lacipirellulaceae bacterium]|nr:arylsulfatase [Lacipirellulaceae bacterium]